MGLEFDLDELVAELPTRGTCQVFLKMNLIKFSWKLILKIFSFNSNFKLKFSCSTRDECNLVYNKENYIAKIMIIMFVIENILL